MSANDEKHTLGLEDELDADELMIIKKQADSIAKETDIYNLDKNLDEDINKIEGQRFAVIGYIGPDFKAKTKENGMNIFGVFPTLDEAVDHVYKLNANESYKMFDIGVAEMYKYVTSYPFTYNITQEDNDKYLNEIIIKHKYNLIYNKLKFENRKDKLYNNEDRFVEFDNKSEEVLKKEFEELNKKEEEKKSLLKTEDSVPIHATHARLKELMKKKKEEKQKKEEEEIKSKTRDLDLSPSKIKCGSYNYVAITFVFNPDCDPSNPKFYERIPIKIRGAFNTEEECKEYIKQLIEENDMYDIVCTPMYVWVPCNPDISKIQNEYKDEQLNLLAKGHVKESQNVNTFYSKKNETLDLNNITSKSTENETKIKDSRDIIRDLVNGNTSNELKQELSQDINNFVDQYIDSSTSISQEELNKKYPGTF